MKKVLITEGQIRLVEDFSNYDEYFDQIKVLIWSGHKDNIVLAIEILKGLVPELKQIDKRFSVSKFINANFGFIFKALGIRNIKEYSEYGDVLINISGKKNLKLLDIGGSYILLDWDKKMYYSIEDTREGLTHEEVVELIGGFNPNFGLLDLYKNMYGYDVFLSKGKYIVKYSNDVYILKKGVDAFIVYHFYDQKNKKELVKWEWDEDANVPPIIRLIKATLDGENIKGINGGYVSKISNSKNYKRFKFYTPKEYIYFEFDNDYSSNDSGYLIFIIKNNDRIYLNYRQFQKNFPEFAKYVQ